MPFSKFVADHIEPCSYKLAPPDAPQVFDVSIWQQCADALADEVLIPACFGVDLYTRATARVHPVTGSASPTLFLAGRGSHSGLHVDFLQTHFWMGLCQGRKRWRLVPRDQLPLLYPRYLTDLNPTFPFDLDALGEELLSRPHGPFRGLGQVAVHEIILEPGDIIFVPRGWPHQVENLETSVALSANFIDGSNVGAACREAEFLGLVEEDACLVAGDLREAVDSGALEALTSTAAAGDASVPLRVFKARHGESRPPSDTQGRMLRVAGLLAALGITAGVAAVVLRRQRAAAS